MNSKMSQSQTASSGDSGSSDVEDLVKQGDYTITCAGVNTSASPEKSVDTPRGHKARKYEYDLVVDPFDYDKATLVKMRSLARPHMRAFWYANLVNRATIFMWFSAVPLYDEMAITLNLTKRDIWMSSIMAILGVLVSRLLTGILCDRYGARLPIAALVIFAAIPCALQGIVTSAMALNITRFFVGMGGGVYVGVTFWMDSMFKKDRLGRIHGFTGGTGLAMIAVQGTIRTVMFPALRHFTGSAEMAWRITFSLISLGSLLVGLPLICLTDDTPRGNYQKLKKTGELSTDISHWNNFVTAICDMNVVILCIQFACNLGVELVANNALNMYFMEEFGVDPDTAIVLASLFSISNQLARTMGGNLNDFFYRKYGLQGRLKSQLVFLSVAGILLILFAVTRQLVLSCVLLCLAAVSTFFSQASTSSITPYLTTDSNSMVTGLIGASGVAGGIGISLIFQNYAYRESFVLTGILMLVAALLSFFVRMPGYGFLLFNSSRRRSYHHFNEHEDDGATVRLDEESQSAKSSANDSNNDDNISDSGANAGDTLGNNNLNCEMPPPSVLLAQVTAEAALSSSLVSVDIQNDMHAEQTSYVI